jgi:non-ribosomal peptide synthetase component E (peptide arylation enzyme)
LDRSKDIIISGGEVRVSFQTFNMQFYNNVKSRMLHLWPSSKVCDEELRGNRKIINLRIITELASHPDILEVSVVARQHVKWGERPMAFVVIHPDHVSKWKGRYREFEKDLEGHAKKRLPGFACPEWVEVVPELPVSLPTIL